MLPNIHPALVHFPISLFVIAFAFLLGSKLLGTHRSATQWASVGHWTLWLGALSAIVAALSGWQAYTTVDHDAAGHAAMTVHRNWALVTLGLAVLVGGWDAWRHQVDQSAGGLLVALATLLCAAVIATAWLGGEVVYRHGIGVLALPEAGHGDGGHDHAGQAHQERREASPPSGPHADVPTAVTAGPTHGSAGHEHDQGTEGEHPHPPGSHKH